MATLHFPIRVPGELLEELGAFTGHFWSDSLRLEPYICEAIRNYIDPPAPEPQAQAAQSDPQSGLGYQWKEVFLPEGSTLRASFDKKPYFATVRGAEIKYGDHAVSPSCFANLYGSGNRNAWKAIWLRLPGSDAWLLADVYRAARKAAIARLMTGDTREDQRPSTAEPSMAKEPATPLLPLPSLPHLPPAPAPAAAQASATSSASRSTPPSWLRPRAPAAPAARSTAQPAMRPRPVSTGPAEARVPARQDAPGAEPQPGDVTGDRAGKGARRRKRRRKKDIPAKP